MKVSGVATAFESIDDTEGLFGDYSEDENKGIILTLNLPVSGDGTTSYRVVQTNPALDYFISDPSVNMAVDGKYVKDKTYILPVDGDFPYSLIIEAGTSATVELYQNTTLLKAYYIDANDLVVS